ncbi:hypothetical protein [Desulfovibrio inopinatus]|uniref:hypothetical protein n=1 Tax=Desulfovibrio inopinatus TaxID=102109 RepID=UPI000420069B|nr:hypothetical protein [Desulfovibrio inopinatus]
MQPHDVEKPLGASPGEEAVFAVLARYSGWKPALRAYFAYKNLEHGSVGKLLGVSRQMVGQLLAGSKTPSQRINQLKELGLPDELLPQQDATGVRSV